MKIRSLFVDALGLSFFLYFFIPVAFEYFNYAILTNSYLRYFHPNFPDPKLYLISENGFEQESDIQKRVFVDDLKANVSLISRNGNESTWIFNMDESAIDYELRWNVAERDYIHSYRFFMKFDGSNEWKEIPVLQRWTSDYPALSTQISRIAPPPYGGCMKLNEINDINTTCLNVRFIHLETFGHYTNSTGAYVFNSMNILEESDYKFPFSSFIILIFGLIGTFSDITVVSIDMNLHSLHRKVIQNVVNDVRNIIRISSAKQRKIVAYFSLCVISIYHTAFVTEAFFQYPIQSTATGGSPLIQSPIIAKMCLHRISPNMSTYLESFKKTLIGRINECETKNNFYYESGKFCVHIVAVDECDWVKRNILFYMDWDHKNWKEPNGYILLERKNLLGLQIVPPDPGIIPSMKMRILYFKNSFEKLFYFRGEYLKGPYETMCVDYVSNLSMNRLKCVEEAYHSIERIFKFQSSVVVVASLDSGINMKVTPQISLLDYISYISTIIGFWLGLSILGSAENIISISLPDSVVKKFLRFSVYCTLSGGLTYFIVLRLTEYLTYDVVAGTVSSDTPGDLKLPPISFTIFGQDAEANAIWPDPYKNWPKVPETYEVPSAYELNEAYKKARILFKNVSVVDHDGIITNVDDILNYKSYIYYYMRIVSMDIGFWKFGGTKHITLDLNNFEGGLQSLLNQIIQDSRSIVEESPIGINDNTLTLPHSHIAESTRYQLEYLSDNKLQFHYKYQHLLKAPYRTDCVDYVNPEMDMSSWYHCLINETTLSNGSVSGLIVLSSNNTKKRYMRFDSHGSIEYMGMYQAAQKCKKTRNIKSSCESITSSYTFKKKSSTESSYGYMLIIEPTDTFRTTFSPKYIPIDFLILLLDLIGFWLGINFVFVCDLSLDIVVGTIKFVSNIWRKNVSKIHPMVNDSIQEENDNQDVREKNQENFTEYRCGFKPMEVSVEKLEELEKYLTDTSSIDRF